jgi:hypothetical protein
MYPGRILKSVVITFLKNSHIIEHSELTTGTLRHKNRKIRNENEISHAKEQAPCM